MKNRLFQKLLVKTPPGGATAHCKCPLCVILYIAAVLPHGAKFYFLVMALSKRLCLLK